MEKLLDCVMDIGEQMLVSGGEVHRVEDSLKRIFTAYGAARIDVFIITSSMVVTIHTDDNRIFTQTRRITEYTTDYEKLHKLNELSRNICADRLSSAEIKTRLAEISGSRTYPLWLEFICYATIAGAFTLFFGGGYGEAAVSFLIGGCIRCTIFFCDKVVRNKIFTKFISSFAATLLAFSALKLGLIPMADLTPTVELIPTADKIIIGNIMTLIPGIGLTTALKDLLVGDSIAGMLRTIEACITALAIAAGYFAVAVLSGGAL